MMNSSVAETGQQFSQPTFGPVATLGKEPSHGAQEGSSPCSQKTMFLLGLPDKSRGAFRDLESIRAP